MSEEKILKKKSKQSSLTVAAMSIGVSVDSFDNMSSLIFAYNRFYNDRTEENFNFFLDLLEITKLETHQLYLTEVIHGLKLNKKSNGQKP